MNKILTYAGIGFFALLIFLGAFIGFAKMSGTPLHEVGVVGGLFNDPDGGTEEVPRAAVVEEKERSPKETLNAAGSLLGAFSMPSPFTVNQLKGIETELTNAAHVARKEMDRLRDWEDELKEREDALRVQFAELMDFRTRLEEFEENLNARRAELDRDEAAIDQKERESWLAVSAGFKEGKAEQLVGKLSPLGPKNAAQVLALLEDTRAMELISALPQADYLPYLEAWRSAKQEQ